jgi:hypothetical protein
MRDKRSSGFSEKPVRVKSSRSGGGGVWQLSRFCVYAFHINFSKFKKREASEANNRRAMYGKPLRRLTSAQGTEAMRGKARHAVRLSCPASISRGCLQGPHRRVVRVAGWLPPSVTSKRLATGRATANPGQFFATHSGIFSAAHAVGQPNNHSHPQENYHHEYI